MAMDFFESQDVARKKTGVLVFFFVVAVGLIVLAVYAAIAAIFLYAQYEHEQPVAFWHPELFLGVTAATLLLVLAGSLYKLAVLRSGGAAVAEMLGGVLIDPGTRDPDERKILNVVEEMAIASGMPVPPVYLLPRERGINAFAAGFTPTGAVIGVTRGTVELLSRDELQGVVGHEFSHILNGDMRLNVRLIGLLHGILLIGITGYILLRSAGSSRRYGRSRKDGALGMLLLGLSLLAIGYIGVFFGRLIKSAVSRQREFLADAASVQFTRNPDGLSGALQKIGGLAGGSRIEDAEAEEASHLFFGNALAESLLGWMSTHPPLPIRIRRIDPAWDGRFPDVERPARAEPIAARARGRDELDKFLDSVRGGPVGASRAAAGGAAFAFQPDKAVSRVGAPGADDIAYASALLAEMPEGLRAAVHEPFVARAVVYALLLDEDPEERAVQLQELQEHGDSAVFEETRRIRAVADGLRPESRLPLVEIALPALRNLSPDQFSAFRENVERLVRADRKIDLFEFTLKRMLLRHLTSHFEPSRPPRIEFYAFRPLARPSAALLSTLAYAGHDDTETAERAFAQAAAVLETSRIKLDMLPPDACGLKAVDAALDELARAAPKVKKRVLRAAATGIGVDGRVTVHEAELLRAVADSLDCPMPPLVLGRTKRTED